MIGKLQHAFEAALALVFLGAVYYWTTIKDQDTDIARRIAECTAYHVPEPVCREWIKP